MTKLELLKQAKELYQVTGGYCGMCWAIKCTAVKIFDRKQQQVKGHPSYNKIVAMIPEFNPEFLIAKTNVLQYSKLFRGTCFWWDVNDVESRIAAFDRLIELYKDNTEEFIY